MAWVTVKNKKFFPQALQVTFRTYTVRKKREIPGIKNKGNV